MERAYPDLANNMFLFTNDYHLAVLENYSFNGKPPNPVWKKAEEINSSEEVTYYTMDSGKTKISTLETCDIVVILKLRWPWFGRSSLDLLIVYL